MAKDGEKKLKVSQSSQFKEKLRQPVVFMPQASAFNQTHAMKVVAKTNTPVKKIRTAFIGE